ncbi:hypothetical protein EEJ42_33370 [Streptomyces botrytidirepellens]|uniref:Uncharacterized protein n=1 Tax=Streptomyces botrytidirepellens TaxID=2486417 RepID=A0A3M8UVP0_9ACTN|nr:hypothetical protein EEJ42_33370 [Streptomyces botrytidirepellens]
MESGLAGQALGGCTSVINEHAQELLQKVDALSSHWGCGVGSRAVSVHVAGMQLRACHGRRHMRGSGWSLGMVVVAHASS